MTGAPPANTPIQPQSSQPRAIEPSHFTRESDLPLKPASGISNSQPLQPMYKSNKRAPWPTPCHIGLIRSFFFFPNVATPNLRQNKSVGFGGEPRKWVRDYVSGGAELLPSNNPPTSAVAFQHKTHLMLTHIF